MHRHRLSEQALAGATAPITPGGTLAVLTAELLAGLTFTQIVRPGTPAILGSLPAGFDLSEDAVALEQINTIGPAGNFLESDQTFELFRELSFESQLWPAMSLESWQNANNPKAEVLLREHTLALLKDASGPDDLDRLRAEGHRFVRALKIEDKR